MVDELEKDAEKNREVRVNATSKIWGVATGMLAICIPLSAATNSGPILPIAVISGAAIGTGAVWQSSEQKKYQNSLLQSSNVKELEERIANLETIVSRDDLDLERRIKQIESNDRRFLQ
jgi:hypothetical protein